MKRNKIRMETDFNIVGSRKVNTHSVRLRSWPRSPGFLYMESEITIHTLFNGFEFHMRYSIKIFSLITPEWAMFLRQGLVEMYLDQSPILNTLELLLRRRMTLVKKLDPE